MRAVGPPFAPAETAAFIVAARGRLQVPFKHQGRSQRGLDCAGLVSVALQATGRPVRDLAAYSREPLRQGLRKALIVNLGPPVPKEDMRAGDVALLRFRGEPSHVGIITDYPHGGFALLHAFAQMKKVVEHRIDDEWFGNIVEVFRP
jgi:cell wall-associated NlpC family hydrolase